jgi:ketosteroid isomerase-like protein
VTSDETSPALRVALAYHRAWTSKDLDQAMSYVADDIICDAPARRIDGAAAYREFMAPFEHMLLDAQLVAGFGDDERALVMYDTRSTLVASGPAAEWVTVKNGKIVYSRFIFDRLPFVEARQGSSQG